MFLCLALATALCGCVQYEDKDDFEPWAPEAPKLPKTPVNVRIVYSIKEANISWNINTDKNDKIEGYKVYRSASVNGQYEEVHEERVYDEKTYSNGVWGWKKRESITHSIKGIPVKTTYYYKVSVYRLGKYIDADSSFETIESELSAPIEITIPDLRYPPNSISATLINHDGVRVEWDAAHDIENNAAYDDVQYNVYRDSVLVDTIPDLFYEDIDLSFGTVYKYTVATVTDASLGSLSLKSPDTSVLTRPGRPVIKAGIAYKNNAVGIGVSWETLKGADSYNVYRSASSDGEYELIQENLNNTQYINTGLAYKTFYYYKVSAANESGEGEQSEYGDMILYTAPNGVKAEFAKSGTLPWITGDAIKIDWDAYPDPAEFRLYCSLDINGDTFLVETLSTNTYNNQEIAGGTIYRYRVAAVIDGYESELSTYSNYVLTRPSAPTGLKCTYTRLGIGIFGESLATNPTISWNPVKGADGYRLYRDGHEIAEGDGTSYTDILAGGSLGLSHSYSVTAYNRTGESYSSRSVSYN